MSSSPDTLVVGTRGSLLARTQTQWTIDRLQQAHPRLDIRMEIIRTTGDKLQSRPLPEIGGKGLFTAELEEALMAGTIDLAVHSAKDLPTELREGLTSLACPPREDPRDAWISADGRPFMKLPPGGLVGTSSLRRQAQLLIHRPDLTFIGLRGNVDTRIRKVKEGQCAGAVLAMAGLNRANLARHVTEVFDPSFCLPAPGQGALALEGRGDDPRVADLLVPIHDASTAAAVEVERAILAALDAGCRAPVAVYAAWEGNVIYCEALVANPTGTRVIRSTAEEKDATLFSRLVDRIVVDLKSQGAADIIAECRAGE
ncbi:MAG TPA: hydroxymethylbilane synthase [Phycisphaerae bacterium]|nr:hydroxymethylbilane synthase [Phycisphaerae bacterium]